MSEPVYHHYISNFYLKGFAIHAGKRPKIHFFDKVTQKSGKKTTDKIGGADHFNRSFSKIDPNSVEKFYARSIETPAGAALKRIVKQKSLPSKSDLQDILRFLAMTTARNPKARIRIEEPMRYLDQLLIRSALGDDGADVLNSRMKRDLLPQEHVAMEIKIIDPIFQSLCSKEWSLLEAPEDSGGLITCDDPLQIISCDDPRPWGFESNGAVIYAPLSPFLAIVGKARSYKNTNFFLNLEQVARLNYETLSAAHRLVFFKSDCFYFALGDELKIVRWGECNADV